MKLTFTTLEDARQAWRDIEQRYIVAPGMCHAWIFYDYRNGTERYTIQLRKYWKAISAFEHMTIPLATKDAS